MEAVKTATAKKRIFMIKFFLLAISREGKNNECRFPMLDAFLLQDRVLRLKKFQGEGILNNQQSSRFG